MLKSYLGLQQEALEALGKERQRMREEATREEQRTLWLQEVIGSLSLGATAFHPLLWQNRLQMDGQLRHLLAHQVQQLALAKLDLERHEGEVLKQFGRVKGLELLLDKRERALSLQRELWDQRQLDELSGLRYRQCQEKD